MPGFSPEDGFQPYQDELAVVIFMEERLDFLRQVTGKLAYPTLGYLGSGGSLLEALPFNRTVFVDQKPLKSLPHSGFLFKDLSRWQHHEDVQPAKDLMSIVKAFGGNLVGERVDTTSRILNAPITYLNLQIPGYPLKDLVYLQHSLRNRESFDIPELKEVEDELVIFVRAGLDILYRVEEAQPIPNVLRPRAIIYDSPSMDLWTGTGFSLPRQLINAGYIPKLAGVPNLDWGYGLETSVFYRTD